MRDIYEGQSILPQFLKDKNKNHADFKKNTAIGSYKLSNGKVFLSFATSNKEFKILTCTISHSGEVIEHLQEDSFLNKRIVFQLDPDRNVLENTFSCKMKYNVVGGNLLNQYTATYKWNVSFI